MVDFGDVRSVLHRESSEAAFAALMRLIERAWRQAPRRALEELVPYTVGALQGWPERARRAPGRWRPSFFGGASELPDELTVLCRRLVRTRQSPTPEELGALASSARARGLTWLELTHGEIGVAHLEALAEAPALAKVRHLELGAAAIGPAGVEVLASASEWPRRLEHLALWRNPLGDRGAEALAQASWPRLRALDLVGARVGDEGARALAQAEGFPRLERLMLSYNHVGERGAAALAELAGRVEIDLAHNP